MRDMCLTILLSFGLLLSSASADDFFGELVLAARERTTKLIVYNGQYRRIDYPMGDVPLSIGVCTDVVIRSYRKLGIDLQQLVHEDMVENFSEYPAIWGLSRPDSNIDHRRVPNLEAFFTRYGETIPPSRNGSDYLPGDMVTWRLTSNQPHIGIVSDRFSDDGERPLIIHNIGWGPQENDMLFDYNIIGHFRFKGS